MQKSLETRSMSRSRMRIRIIGGKAPWEHEIKIWFDEMYYDCIAFGVMILRTRHQLCDEEQMRQNMLLITKQMKPCMVYKNGLSREPISASCYIRGLWKKSSMVLMSLLWNLPVPDKQREDPRNEMPAILRSSHNFYCGRASLAIEHTLPPGFMA